MFLCTGGDFDGKYWLRILAENRLAVQILNRYIEIQEFSGWLGTVGSHSPRRARTDGTEGKARCVRFLAGCVRSWPVVSGLRPVVSGLDFGLPKL